VKNKYLAQNILFMSLIVSEIWLNVKTVKKYFKKEKFNSIKKFIKNCLAQIAKHYLKNNLLIIMLKIVQKKRQNVNIVLY